jgi:acyl-CoA thioester hydrolase
MKPRLELRVHYDDAAFSGRVYHASYLRFLERGRTEWLRSLGCEHRSLSEVAGLIFAVRQLRIEFLAPRC